MNRNHSLSLVTFSILCFAAGCADPTTTGPTFLSPDELRVDPVPEAAGFAGSVDVSCVAKGATILDRLALLDLLDSGTGLACLLLDVGDADPAPVVEAGFAVSTHAGNVLVGSVPVSGACMVVNLAIVRAYSVGG